MQHPPLPPPPQSIIMDMALKQKFANRGNPRTKYDKKMIMESQRVLCQEQVLGGLHEEIQKPAGGRSLVNVL